MFRSRERGARRRRQYFEEGGCSAVGAFCSGEEDQEDYILLGRNAFGVRGRGVSYIVAVVFLIPFPPRPSFVSPRVVITSVLPLHLLYFNHFSLLSAATEESISRFQSTLSSCESRECFASDRLMIPNYMTIASSSSLSSSSRRDS